MPSCSAEKTVPQWALLTTLLALPVSETIPPTVFSWDLAEKNLQDRFEKLSATCKTDLKKCLSASENLKKKHHLFPVWLLGDSWRLTVLTSPCNGFHGAF